MKVIAIASIASFAAAFAAASMIARRESELQMQSLRTRYEAERSGDPVDHWRNRNASKWVARNAKCVRFWKWIASQSAARKT